MKSNYQHDVNMSEDYNRFVEAMIEQGYEVDGSQLSLKEKMLVGNVYDQVVNFIEDNQLAVGSEIAALENFTKPITTMNSQVNLNDIGHAAILDLCTKAEIPASMMYPASLAVAAIFSRGNVDPMTYLSNDRTTINDVEFKPLSTFFSGDALASFANDEVKAMEAFGKDMDKLITDTKVNLTVTLMKFHKTIIDRMMFRKQCNSNTVQLTIAYDEVYDLAKISTPESHKERNRGRHRIPFIHLYRWPETANTQGKRIVPLKANDTGTPALLNADNQILFGHTVPLLDLAMDATKFGYNHIDMSDLVSEGVRFETVYIDIDGEIFSLNVRHRHGAGFLERTNAQDSSDRTAVMNETFILNSETPTAAGVANTKLAAFTGESYLKLNVNATGTITLKTGELNTNCIVNAAAETRSGDPVPGGVATAMAALTFKGVYFTLDARYNEENMRKTTSCVRMHTRPMSVEIPVGKNFIADYSLSQPQPERVLDTISRLTALGNDVRHIDLITDCINNVADRIKEEESLGQFADYWNKVVFEYAAGMRCLPYIIKEEMDLGTITSMKDSEILSDIRGKADKFFVEVFAKLYTFSMYPNALERGEKPVFKVITSNPVMASVFNVEHIHNHLDHRIPVDGENVEFVRILPNGTRLEVITTTWESMVDKIIAIPFRPQYPEDVLNFGLNLDRGSFVAHYSPTNAHATIRRIAVNSRELMYPTNPVAMIIDVKNISKIYEGLKGLVKP